MSVGTSSRNRAESSSQNKRYGPTQAEALVCEWEDGAVEVRYRGKRMEYEDLVVRPRVEPAAPGEPRRESTKQVGSKSAKEHPCWHGYEQRMRVTEVEGITSVTTRWGVHLRFALNAALKPRRRAALRRRPQRQQQSKNRGHF
jgi:hypothetical protein